MYYVLVNEINNEIHNLYNTSNQKYTSVYTYLSPNFYFSIQKRFAQVLTKLFLSTSKALQFFIQAQT